MNPDGTITLTPAENYAGDITFTYTVADTGNPVKGSDATRVTVTVGANRVTAVPDSDTVARNGSVNTDVLANDRSAGPPLDRDSLAVTTAPAHGTTGPSGDGGITYIPARGYSGPDTYGYRICDRSYPLAACASTTVDITVAVETVVAQDDTATTPPTRPVTVRVRANDSTGSGATLAAPTLQSAPRGGDATVEPGGDVVYTPRAGFSGDDSLTYQVCDTGDTPVCASATVRIAVLNTVTANADDVTVAQNRSTRIQPWDNDTVSDGGAPLDAQSVQLLTQPAHGRVDLNPDGSVTYTPVSGYSGPDTVDYRVCDSGSPRRCATAPVRVDVTANTVIARDDTAATAAGTPVVITVRANDESTSGQPLAAPTIAQDPRHGTATVGGDDRIRYVPVAGYTGPDRFVYQVCDTGTPPQCTDATVSLAVTAATAPTSAADDTATTAPATPVSIDVRANDRTGAGPLARPALGRVPAHGQAAVNADGTVLYTPARGFSGADSFTYAVCDSAAPPTCASATVTVSVPNEVTATDDQAVVSDGGARRTPVLANDTVTPGGAALDPASVTVITAPRTGTVVRNSDGSITYTPNPGSSGTDNYVYRVCDTSDPDPVCRTATVTVQVRAGVVAANDDARTTTPATAVTFDPRENDSSTTERPLGLPSGLTTPGHGTATVGADGQLTYTPARGFSGADTFAYTVCDSAATTVCDTAQVRIRVVTTVIANPDTARTYRDTAVVLDLLGNDTVAADGAPLDPASVTVLGGPDNGTVSVAAGRATYTPATGYTGADLFTYRVCDTSDPEPVCAQTTASVTVDAPDIEPVADARTTPPGTPVTVRVLDNDRSKAGFAAPTIVRAPAKGRAVVDADGTTVTYTPDKGTSGVDTFDYQVCEPDAPGDCAVAMVTITVANEVTARDDAARTPAGTAVTTAVLGNDAVLPDAAPLDPASVTVVGRPAHGTVVVARNGTVIYTPADGFSGQDTYRYQVCDTSTPDPVCAQASVTVTVDPGPTSPPFTPTPPPVTPGPPPANDPAPVQVVPPAPVEVVPPAPVEVAPAPAADPVIVTEDPVTPQRRGPLAFTGAVVAPAAGIGLAALAVGTTLVLLARRRRSGR